MTRASQTPAKETMRFKDWPNCPTPDCQFKVCTWAGTGRCSPCSKAKLGEVEMQRRYNATHTDGKLNADLEGIDPTSDGGDD